MTAEQLRQWREAPETKEFFNYLWRLRLIAMEDWAHFAFVGDSPEASNRMNDRALGQVEAISKLLTVNEDDINATFSDTGGISAFQYPIGRKDSYQPGTGLDAISAA